MKDRIVLKFLEYVTIEVKGCEQTIQNIKEYFPNLFSTEKIECDYYIEYKGIINEMPNIPSNCKKITPFKAPDYFVFKNEDVCYAYSITDEFSDKHLIERNKKNISIYSTGPNYEMLATRICREIIFRVLISKGFTPIHASAISKNNKCLLFIGKGGSGKSTSMIYNVIKNDYYPVANDIVMAGYINGNTKIIGIPFKVTISSEVINSFGFNFPNQSKKLRFSISDFEKQFNKTWVWESDLSQVFLLDYNNFMKSYDITSVNSIDLNKYVKEVNIEENFKHGDYLQISNLTPSNDYSMLNNNPLLIEGNILNYFKRS